MCLALFPEWTRRKVFPECPGGAEPPDAEDGPEGLGLRFRLEGTFPGRDWPSSHPAPLVTGGEGGGGEDPWEVRSMGGMAEIMFFDGWK